MKLRYAATAFILLVIIYLGLVFLMPPDPATLQKYNLSEAQATLINIGVVLPLVSIWVVAFRGFAYMRAYAASVAASPEGKSFKLLSIGLMLLAFGLPINSIVSNVTAYLVRDHMSWFIPATVTKNYVTLLLSLAALLTLAAGAKRLMHAYSKKLKTDNRLPGLFAPALIVLSAVYAWIITSAPFTQSTSGEVYYLPNWLLIFTIVVPYLLAWNAGMLTAYKLYEYHNKVPGKVYKRAFANIAVGIAGVVIVSILIQLISTSSAQLSRLDLTPLLAIIYLLLIMYAVGFGLVARGARKLKRIEEV